MSLSGQLTGTIIKIEPANTKNKKFVNQRFVLQVEKSYQVGGKPVHKQMTISFQAVNTGVQDLGRYSEGEVVKVSYDLEGFEHNDRYYNTLKVWKVES